MKYIITVLTCLFQTIELIADNGSDFLPGVIGLDGFFKSQIYISLSFAPEANKFFYKKSQFKKIL